MCLHIYAGKLQSTDQWGLLSKYHKDKEPAPTGKTEFDQSKALFQVRITFQLLKLMNSLYWLMKPSVANKDDSVFVLFTAHSKNNIVKALLYKPEAARSKKKKKKQEDDFTVYFPSHYKNKHVEDNQCSHIFGSFYFSHMPISCEIRQL